MGGPSPLVLAKGSIDGVQRPQKIPREMRMRRTPLPKMDQGHRR